MLYRFVDDIAQNIALNMINIASRSVSEGMEATLLKYKWEHAGFDAASLSSALSGLIDGDIIEIHHVDGEPMLRFSRAAYERLFEAPAIPPSDAQAETSELRSDTTRPEAPRLNTEYALRDALLAIYRELKLTSGSEVLADTLARFWREAERRAEDLRLALDIAVRDGHIEIVRGDFETKFRLSEDGALYMRGPPAPEALMAHLPPVNPEHRNLRAIPDGHLMRHLICEFSSDMPERRFEELSQPWDEEHLPRASLLHGLDLLIKDRFLVITQDDPLRLAITEDGLTFLKRAQTRMRRMRTQHSVNKAGRLN